MHFSISLSEKGEETQLYFVRKHFYHTPSGKVADDFTSRDCSGTKLKMV